MSEEQVISLIIGILQILIALLGKVALFYLPCFPAEYRQQHSTKEMEFSSRYTNTVIQVPLRFPIFSSFSAAAQEKTERLTYHLVLKANA